MQRLMRACCAASVVFSAAAATAVAAEAVQTAAAADARVSGSLAAAPSARVILSWREDAEIAKGHPWTQGADLSQIKAAASRRAQALGRRHGLSLRSGRVIGRRAQVLTATGLSSAALARRLSADRDVVWAVVDQRRRALFVPNDPLFAAGPALNLGAQSGGPEAGQWTLRAPDAVFRSATNAQSAWDRSTGSGVVVAVLDTGVRLEHPDLQGQLLPGYDFVADGAAANDGGGRDNDASDPGDWITEAEANQSGGPYFGCTFFNRATRRYVAEDSSWHGTLVSGIVAGSTNNGIGMAGLAHGAKLLPVRVLGKCGGWDSDIIAGMLWAAGVDEAGLPANPHPARVLNLSLGSEGACNAAYQEAVARVIARGAVVVAAAGNTAGRAVGTPANCPGVIAVAGLRHAGSKVGFSDLGPEIAISAPGGNCVNIEAGTPCLYPILSTANSGRQQPQAFGSIYTDSFNISVGTSFATPMVAGVSALILSVRPDLSPAEVRRALQDSARPFPTWGADNGPSDPEPVGLCRPPDGSDQLQCYCSTSLCGAGMLDANAAVTLALGFGRTAPATPADASNGNTAEEMPASTAGSGAGGGASSPLWLAALAGATLLLHRAGAGDARRRKARQRETAEAAGDAVAEGGADDTGVRSSF